MTSRPLLYLPTKMQILVQQVWGGAQDSAFQQLPRRCQCCGVQGPRIPHFTDKLDEGYHRLDAEPVGLERTEQGGL